MRKFFLVLLLVPFFCYAQDETRIDSIPVIDGKVVFSSEYHPSLNQEEIHKRLKNWLINLFLNENEIINIDDTEKGVLACRKTDELQILKKAFSSFSMNFRYTIILEYRDNFCTATIRNITFSDPDEQFSKTQQIPTIYPGESILIEKKFKNLFIKNTSDLIIEKTLDRIETIFYQIEKSLASKK